MPIDENALKARRKLNKISKELRQHQQELEQDKEDATDFNSEKLAEHFERAEANLQKSKTADHALVDAEIFHRLGYFSRAQAEQLHSGLRTCDVKSFTDNLIEFMRRESEDDEDVSLNFSKLGNACMKQYATVPSLDFMYGNQIKEAAPAAEKKVRKVKKGLKAVKPSELRTEEVEQTETDKRVALMKRILRSRVQCNFWVFVIDPESFSRSVENVFHSSFLIKESWAELDLKREPPLLKYREPKNPMESQTSTQENTPSDRISNSEFILALDTRTWREMIEKHDIRQSILPRHIAEVPKDAEFHDLQCLERRETAHNSAAF